MLPRNPASHEPNLRRLMWFARMADELVDAVGSVCAWLVLLVIACLFAQWPLREFLGFGHILANDFGQIAHAAVFMVGAAYALRWDGHVRLDLFYRRMSERARATVDLVGTLLFVIPWSTLILWYSWPTTVRSVLGFEKFPDTWSPGYWLFKVLLIVFAALLLVQSLGHVARDVANLFGHSKAAADAVE